MFKSPEKYRLLGASLICYLAKEPWTEHLDASPPVSSPLLTDFDALGRHNLVPSASVCLVSESCNHLALLSFKITQQIKGDGSEYEGLLKVTALNDLHSFEMLESDVPYK